MVVLCRCIKYLIPPPQKNFPSSYYTYLVIFSNLKSALLTDMPHLSQSQHTTALKHTHTCQTHLAALHPNQLYAHSSTLRITCNLYALNFCSFCDSLNTARRWVWTLDLPVWIQPVFHFSELLSLILTLTLFLHYQVHLMPSGPFIN